MKRGGLVFSEDFAATAGDSVVVWWFLVLLFLIGLFNWGKQDQKVSLSLRAVGVGDL